MVPPNPVPGNRLGESVSWPDSSLRADGGVLPVDVRLSQPSMAYEVSAPYGWTVLTSTDANLQTC